jgi:hypothetical protein
MTSDTPRTDQLALLFKERVGYGTGRITPDCANEELWNHARTLERELANSRRSAGCTT